MHKWRKIHQNNAQIKKNTSKQCTNEEKYLKTMYKWRKIHQNNAQIKKNTSKQCTNEEKHIKTMYKWRKTPQNNVQIKKNNSNQCKSKEKRLNVMFMWICVSGIDFSSLFTICCWDFGAVLIQCIYSVLFFLFFILFNRFVLSIFMDFVVH
jgi:hypothetical protein